MFGEEGTAVHVKWFGPFHAVCPLTGRGSFELCPVLGHCEGAAMTVLIGPSFLLGGCLGAELCGHRLGVYLIARLILKVVYQFTLPTSNG